MQFEVHIQLLNGFSLTEGSEETSDFYPPRIQSLLTYLILNRHTPQPRQKVAFLLWPDSTEKQAFTNLRKLLYVIRKAQNGNRIIDIKNRSLQYSHDDAHQVDLISFENHLLAASRSTEDRTKRRHLEAAIDLYRGELTPHLNDEWLIDRRQDLHNRYITAVLELIQLLEKVNDLPKAIFYGERLLQADRFRESTYQLLMKLHLRQNDHAAALTVFDSCRRLLADELGVSPSGPTEKLYLEALAVEKQPGDLAESSLVRPKAIKHNLPFQPTSFIGREDELITLENFLLDANCRLISILGAGGMGKTRLALALAQKLLDQQSTQFPDGIFFAPLTDVRDPSQIPVAIATACNLSLGSGEQPFRAPALQVLDYLREKRLLLIFDNFEHLIEEPQFLLDILSTAPDNKLIVTSREKLRLRSEQRFLIEGLDFPDNDFAKELTEYTAVKLFLQNAQRVNHRFKLAATDEVYLHQICQLVEGMPLAVELAAGWADMLSLQEIAAKIQEGLDFLESDARDMPAHHRSMRVVIDTSWHRLDEVERRIFPQLSIFRGGFSLEAAGEITGADVETLNGLCNKSLL
ncbi:MAG: BTAD domain-containing putative transcriptional regulator, partial [Chloroflexota bacterium]